TSTQKGERVQALSPFHLSPFHSLPLACNMRLSPRMDEHESSPHPDPPSTPSERARDAALSSFFWSLPATVWMTDERLVLTFVRGVYLRRLGIDPAKVIGRSVQDILLDGREDHPLIQGHLPA